MNVILSLHTDPSLLFTNDRCFLFWSMLIETKSLSPSDLFSLLSVCAGKLRSFILALSEHLDLSLRNEGRSAMKVAYFLFVLACSLPRVASSVRGFGWSIHVLGFLPSSHDCPTSASTLGRHQSPLFELATPWVDHLWPSNSWSVRSIHCWGYSGWSKTRSCMLGVY